MNPRPLVSVIVPAFNAETVLAEALLSVQNQTYPHYEIIVVDDGSTDRTRQIAARFAGSDPRIRFFEQANAGSAAARNTALRHARGEWIAFLDADDTWLPAKLERVKSFSASDASTSALRSSKDSARRNSRSLSSRLSANCALKSLTCCLSWATSVSS